jgi:ribosomal protein S27AE
MEIINYEMMRKMCWHCGASTMHEHGKQIDGNLVVGDIWTCMKCGKTAIRRKDAVETEGH